MAFYCQCMLEIALILSEDDPMYEETAYKFAEHFMWIAYAMDRIGEHHDEMWDEQDGFFYDLLRLPDGQAMRLKVRSLVGLLPLCASTVFEARRRGAISEADGDDRPVPQTPSRGSSPMWLRPTRVSSAIKDGVCCRSSTSRSWSACSRYMLDENEFLGPHGIRSLSRYHLDHPFVFHVGGQEYKVQYLPGESDTGMFGGNSNWRGPGLDAGQCAADPRALEPVQLLRR